MSNEAGSRRKCTKCGAEVAVIRGGDGEVHCCDTPMEPKS